jgi:hypothetical protein
MLELDTPEAYKDADTDTAWRIESSLREFPNFIPRCIWFRYPLHEEEREGELRDQPTADEARGRKSGERDEDGGNVGRPPNLDDDTIDDYFDEYVVDGFASSAVLSAVLNVSERTIRRYKSDRFEYVQRKGLRRIDGK